MNVRLLGSNVLKIPVHFTKLQLLRSRQSSVTYIRQAVRRSNKRKVTVAFHFILLLMSATYREGVWGSGGLGLNILNRDTR